MQINALFKQDYVGTLRVAQVLVLTHERAGAEEIVPYLKAVFYPVPVVCLFGRCAVEEPQINKESCVYYGWKDQTIYNNATCPASFV